MVMRNKSGQFLKGHNWRSPQPFREKEWLENEYVKQKRSTGDIASEFSVTDVAILFWLRKHGIPRRSIAESRKIKHWGQLGSDNPMWNKRGELNPRWLGGVTPERQAFYTSKEWKSACSSVWKRDKAKCRRCGIFKKDQEDIPFHIHHIESFANKELRADTSNLVLLCEVCHHFVHSKKNTNNEFLP
jgi:hypothetical protein